jgi:hypothetical protein
VDHLVGYNLSVRRAAFARFEEALRPYWQNFELDLCLQVRSRGYRVCFDFANVVEHHPTNTLYASGRGGDLQVKIHNAAFNYAFVLAKHSSSPLRYVRLLYLLVVGTIGTPGLLGALAAAYRLGNPVQEIAILKKSWIAKGEGWRAGARVRRAGAGWRMRVRRA